MKKLTARNETEKPDKKRGPDDMRSMPVDPSKKKRSGGFTKVGAPAPEQQSRFKKVGTSVGQSKSEEEKPGTTSANTGGPVQTGPSEAEKKLEADKTAEEDANIEQLLKESEALNRKIEDLKAREAAKKLAAETPTPAPAPPHKEVDVVMGGMDDEKDRELARLEREIEETERELEEAESEMKDTTEQPTEESKPNAGPVEEDITWEEYDFTKPTGCDPKTCPGCNTDGIWDSDSDDRSSTSSRDDHT